MAVDTESLAVFVEVAKLSSFSGASRSLKLPSTSVSYKVNKLEESLRVQLFNRTTRIVELTEIGREIFAKAEELLEIANEIGNLADSKISGVKGSLRISAPQALGSHLLGRWLIDFHIMYPGVRVELLSSNRYLDMQKDRLDFVFRLGPLSDSSLIARKLFDVQFCTFASPKFLDAHPEINHPNDLLQIPCVAAAMEGEAIDWHFHKDDTSLQLHVNGLITFEDIEWLIKAAVAHAGVAQLPLNMIDKELNSGQLIPVLKEWWPDPLTMYLVYAKEKHVSAKNRYFINYIIDMCSNLYNE